MFELYEVEQYFSDTKLVNWREKVNEEIRKHPSLKDLPKGASIAITAGSRGITNIVGILKEIVRTLQEMHFSPFLIPAMGSHGGANSEGQLSVLHHLGITEETVGAPIHSSMNVILLGHTKNNLPVYMDEIASKADGIIVVNRIKVHTAFRGKVESGLSKMITIGLGKQKGASFVHSRGPSEMYRNIHDVAEFVLQNTSALMGLAIVENGKEETAEITAVSKDNWFEKEGELLELSKKLMPRLPVHEIDILIIEEMGKCFSGTGMDPNIIGRWRIKGVNEPTSPNIRSIGVLDLAEQSFGNAQGIGLADFTSKKLVDKIDRHSTYMNALTSTYIQRAMIPLYYDTEKEMIGAAIKNLGPSTNLSELKVIQIPNTLHLHRLLVTKAVLDEMDRENKNVQVIDKHPFAFNAQGDIVTKLSS